MTKLALFDMLLDVFSRLLLHLHPPELNRTWVKQGRVLTDVSESLNHA